MYIMTSVDAQGAGAALPRDQLTDFETRRSSGCLQIKCDFCAVARNVDAKATVCSVSTHVLAELFKWSKALSSNSNQSSDVPSRRTVLLITVLDPRAVAVLF